MRNRKHLFLSLTVIVALAVMIAASGCSRRMSAFRRRVPASNGQPPEGTFWIFADSQLHNFTGAPTLARSALLDSITKVAIRPPSLDLWAEVVLKRATRKIVGQDPGGVAFFLGDAANISCIDEYQRFVESIDPALTWFGVLGNHDGFYMGNLSYVPAGASGPGSWAGACSIDGEKLQRKSKTIDQLATLEVGLWHSKEKFVHATQGVLSKTHAVWLYLASLHARKGLRHDPLECDNWIPTDYKGSEKYSCEASPARPGGLRLFRSSGTYLRGSTTRTFDVVAAIDSAAADTGAGIQAWHAFLLQDIEIADGVHALLVDTSDLLNAPPRPGLLQWRAFLPVSPRNCLTQTTDESLPGKCGEINDVQISEINEMLRVDRQLDESIKYFLIGHHPWGSLRHDSIQRMRSLLEQQPGFSGYISGHTHAPSATLGLDALDHWEVNLASTTDWPMEIGRVGYRVRHPSGSSRASMTVDIVPVSHAESSCPYFAEDPAMRERQESREMAYQNNRAYVNRALDVYASLVRSIVADGSSANCEISGESRGLPAVIEILRSHRKMALGAQRVLLDEVSRCDRSVLRLLPNVEEREAACATWASHLEYDRDHRDARMPLSVRVSTEFEIQRVPSAE